MIIFIIIGLLIVITAMTKLGGKRLFGQPEKGIEIGGMYTIVRNPQLYGYGIVLLGLTLIYPNLYTAGWIILYC